MQIKRGFWDGFFAGVVVTTIVALVILSGLAIDERSPIPDWVVVQNTLEEPVNLTCWRETPESVLWSVNVPVMGTVKLDFGGGNIHAAADFPKQVGLTMIGQRTGKTVEVSNLVPQTVMVERPYRVILLENEILLVTAVGATVHVND
jgi:hypothetical protein